MDSRRFESESDYMREFFLTWVRVNGSQGPIGELACWLACDPPEPNGYESVVIAHGLRDTVDWFVRQRCDLVLEYIAARLKCEAPSEIDTATTDKVMLADDTGEAHPKRKHADVGSFADEAAITVALLRRLLHVDGKTLVKHRPREMAVILATEIADHVRGTVVSGAADAHLANVQAALDLSYDWYLRLARPALQSALSIERQRLAHTIHCPPEFVQLLAQNSDLATLTRLAELQPHSLADLH